MTETDFLDDYDPTAFERPSVTVDLVLLGLRQGSPTALLVKRQQNPFAGQWALPGGFVRIDEAVDDAAKRILHDKAGIQSAHLEQLYTFGSVNQTGTFLGMRAALPVMAANGGGSIVNISSLLGLLGFPGMIAYSASKGAIRTMTKAVAMECVSNNIRVNTIVPGAMQTPIQANVTAEADAWQRSKIPMGDLGEPDDIAFGALYLSSDEAKYVTGAELVIDGGWSVSA